MIVATYISDLLYRYECVILPGFGAFVSNEISAKVDQLTHTFDPPSKQIAFNPHIKTNDGLLANYVSSKEGISYEKALYGVKEFVETLNNTLVAGEVELENIGTLTLNSTGNIVFEPSCSVNYLTSSFGLHSYVSPAVKRLAYREQVRHLETIAPGLATPEKTRKSPVFLKYAATAAIILALGSVGWNQYQNKLYNNEVAAAEKKQQEVNQSIQEATFVIDNPLPAITLNVTKETHNYHIIAGAFREPQNAEKKLGQLLKKGFNARILGINKWNLTQVSFDSFDSRSAALQSLNTIKRTVSKDAWLLVKEY